MIVICIGLINNNVYGFILECKENQGPGFFGHTFLWVNYKATFKMSPWQQFFLNFDELFAGKSFIRMKLKKSFW